MTNNSMIRFFQITVAALSIATAHISFSADTFVWDPDGAGNSPTLNLNTFQFGAGNSLFQGSIPFTQGDQFQMLFQAQLNSIVSSTGAQITPTGLNASGSVGAVTPFEITVVGSVTEAVTNVNNTPGRVVFRVAGSQAATSFVELYYDGSQNASPLAGTGYNDGTLILRGAPTPPNPDVGSFALSNPQPTVVRLFDSFGTNDYATGGNTNTISGIGATTMDITITYVDPAFFVAPGTGNSARQIHIGDIISLDITHAAPFDKVDPSRKFAGVANSGTGSGPAPSATPRIGMTNGANGPDFQAQSLVAIAVRPGLSGSPTPTPSATPTPTPGGSPTPTPTPGGSPTPTPTGTPTGLRVVISANKTQVREGGDVTITFTVKGGVSHPALTVNYSVAGSALLNTDYTLSGTAGNAVIPSNTASATVTLHANTDTVNEGDGEGVKLVIEPGTGYDVPGQLDAKRVNILILDPGT